MGLLGDSFMFVTEDGTIFGWHEGDGENAMLRVVFGLFRLQAVSQSSNAGTTGGY